MKKDVSCKNYSKKAQVSVLISDKVLQSKENYETRTLFNDKRVIPPRRITILNLHDHITELQNK